VSLRAVLFDAAGTLLLTAEPVGETYARALAKHGAAIPAWRLEDAFRRVHQRAPAMLFPDARDVEIPGLEREWWWWRVRETVRAADSEARVADFEGLFDALWSHYAATQAWRPVEGAVAALEALRGRGLATAVVSNMDHRLDALLEGLGLAAQLDAVVRPPHAGAVKPDPAMFLEGLRRLGATPDEAVYVGDDALRDLAGARRAGLRAIDVGELATLETLPRRLAHPCQEPR
jgi:REG-2-like HAD superfamily hydrolase